MAVFRRSNLMRNIAILFALFLVLLVILANAGLAGQMFGWLYNYPNGDKVAHFLLMGTFGLLASLGFPTTRVRLWAISPLKSGLIFAVIVAIEELSQSLFPGRSASLLDLAASLSGVFLLGETGAYFKNKAYMKATSKPE